MQDRGPIRKRKPAKPSTVSSGPFLGGTEFDRFMTLEKFLKKIQKTTMKQPFLKGRLTALSLALFTLIQTPNLLGDLSQTAETFSQAAAQPISFLSLVASAGVIWGGIRRAAGYFGK